MKHYKKALCIAGLGLILSGTELFADQMNAKEIVKKLYTHLGSMDSYAFNAVMVDNETIDGETVIYRQNTQVKIDRPAKLRIDTQGDIKNRTIYMNNGQFSMIDHGYGYYAQLKTPNSIDATLDFLFDKFGIRTALSTLIYSDMNKRVKVKHSKYFGAVDVAGVECDYIAFNTNGKEIHVWITTGSEPLVKALSIIENDTRINFTLTWDTNPQFSKNNFVFVAPKGSAKISVNSAN